jgi:hypothetical protein
MAENQHLPDQDYIDLLVTTMIQSVTDNRDAVRTLFVNSSGKWIMDMLPKLTPFAVDRIDPLLEKRLNTTADRRRAMIVTALFAMHGIIEYTLANQTDEFIVDIESEARSLLSAYFFHA